MPGEAMLRVANVRNEAALENIRDVLDTLGVDYEHARSEPEDDRFPQTAYFYVPDDSAENVEQALATLSAEQGIDAEPVECVPDALHRSLVPDVAHA